jgi:bifunctional pyridoxal-dependent enzyme with beta-cystathionase and maltose regulon repressor activities
MGPLGQAAFWFIASIKAVVASIIVRIASIIPVIRKTCVQVVTNEPRFAPGYLFIDQSTRFMHQFPQVMHHKMQDINQLQSFINKPVTKL